MAINGLWLMLATGPSRPKGYRHKFQPDVDTRSQGQTSTKYLLHFTHSQSARTHDLSTARDDGSRHSHSHKPVVSPPGFIGPVIVWWDTTRRKINLLLPLLALRLSFHTVIAAIPAGVLVAGACTVYT
ncbi:hypothetical protein DL96DRAFT_1716826 [Flagelloscypha sp. PMI_526]|nr:hypothetical protein DL96DRAFT_1716826 [Flagelloscypha sp. PMI_526]